MSTGELLSFGPYLLDPQEKRITCDGADVRIASRHLELLCLLASRPGHVHSKETLIASAWGDVAVTTNSFDQAIFQLRRALPMPSGEPIIETQSRRGVRFVPEVSRVERREPEMSIDEVLETHRAWIEGRAALETLERGAISRARQVFDDVVKRVPGQASAHVGLANACALQFEMTRTDAQPDIGALEMALYHAREACQLNGKYAEAWATLGFVLERIGRRENALAAARQSIELEPDNWHHHVRLSAAGWGNERLGAARRALQLMPGLPMAHWLAASVMVARGLLRHAEEELRIGLTSNDDAPPLQFGCVGLHWLLGLVLLAQQDTSGAEDAFHRELDQEHSGHLYARECAANAAYALGAKRFQDGNREGAREAFSEALRLVPMHPFAAAALGRVPASERLSAVDRTIADAVLAMVRDGAPDGDRKATHIFRALEGAPPGNAGWLLPVEPMLGVTRLPEHWVLALARLRSRAA